MALPLVVWLHWGVLRRMLLVFPVGKERTLINSAYDKLAWNLIGSWCRLCWGIQKVKCTNELQDCTIELHKTARSKDAKHNRVELLCWNCFHWRMACWGIAQTWKLHWLWFTWQHWHFFCSLLQCCCGARAPACLFAWQHWHFFYSLLQCCCGARAPASLRWPRLTEQQLVISCAFGASNLR